MILSVPTVRITPAGLSRRKRNIAISLSPRAVSLSSKDVISVILLFISILSFLYLYQLPGCGMYAYSFFYQLPGCGTYTYSFFYQLPGCGMYAYSFFYQLLGCGMYAYRFIASALIGMVCSQTFPGPVTTVLNRPSPPRITLVKPFIDWISMLHVASIAAT